LRRRALDRRLDEELRFHLDMEAEMNRVRGMTSEEAEYAARRAFRGVQQIKEIYREQRGLPAIEMLLKDLQYGFRTIWKSPALMATAVLSLTLGIGANTAIFSVIQAVMLRPLPVPSPGELVSVGDSSRPTALWEGGPMVSVFSYPLYQRLRDQNRVFTGLLASGRAGRIQARAEMAVLAQAALMDFAGSRLSRAEILDIRSKTVEVEPGGRGFSWIRKHDSRLLFTLMAIFALVLVIGCANVASVLLARAMKRQKEISMRLVLGASRRRLVRQLLTESMLLASLGGISGLLLAGWGSRMIARLASNRGVNPIPFDLDIQPNTAVLAFTAAVTILTAILMGLVPALRSTRIDLTSALKENSGAMGHAGGRAGKALVIGQLALSLILLVGAGLFIRSLTNLQTLDIGYSRANLALLKVDLLGSGYAESQHFAITRRLIQRLLSVPGVTGVTVSENGLFSGTDSNTDSLVVDGFTPAQREDSSSSFDQVGPHSFRVVGAPIIAGRDFDEHDDERAPAVAIINQTMARFYFGNSEPLGKYLANGGDHYTIVGVVKDTKQRDLKGKLERRFYVPLFQSKDRFGAFHFTIRTRAEASGVIPAIRREIESFDRNLASSTVEPVRALVDQSANGDRMIARLSAVSGVLALVLAASGLYGVISYSTSRRTPEIGLRMALGAGRSKVMWGVLGETLVLILAGFTIGLPGALLATRPIAGNLVGVTASDPLTLAVASLVMLLVAGLAGFVPALRAARIDPMVALRRE